MATQKAAGTPVIFRKWPKSEGGDIIALFPAEPGTDDPYTCSSYEHVGQHGSADPVGLIGRTTAATPAEYADLKKELRSVGYNDLVVYQRLQQEFLEARRDKLKGIYTVEINNKDSGMKETNYAYANRYWREKAKRSHKKIRLVKDPPFKGTSVYLRETK